MAIRKLRRRGLDRRLTGLAYAAAARWHDGIDDTFVSPDDTDVR
jgi:hypothetical protein